MRVRQAAGICLRKPCRKHRLSNMISDTLEQCRRYTSLSPRFAAAFEFLEKLPANQPIGRYDIDGDNSFAMVQAYTTKPLDQAKFETHRQYIDIDRKSIR